MTVIAQGTGGGADAANMQHPRNTKEWTNVLQDDMLHNNIDTQLEEFCK